MFQKITNYRIIKFSTYLFLATKVVPLMANVIKNTKEVTSFVKAIMNKRKIASSVSKKTWIFST
jgi:hypothetical protein